jgi:RHS repeat-associated protein
MLWAGQEENYNVFRAAMRQDLNGNDIGRRTDQPLRFPGQEYAMMWEGQEENYNVFRWYRSGWGRYTQADPLGFDGGDKNLFRYALANPIKFSDPLGLRVRICCRPLGNDPNSRYAHCYIEEQRNTTGRRRTWGLHNPNAGGLLFYLTNPSPRSQPRVNDPSDVGGTCESWREDCWPDGRVGDCIQRAFEQYPVESYSEISAPLQIGSGRNSNTFVKCIARKCGLSAGPRVTQNAPGYHQPCPPGF